MTNSKTHLIIQKVTFGALFASIAIIIKIFISFETQSFAIRIFEIPIMIAGILLGPLYGGLVGLVTDLVYSMVNVRGLNVGINLFTLEAIIYGFIPGIIFRFMKYNKISISFTTAVTLLTAFLISTTQLYLWQYPQTAAFFKLLPIRIVIIPIKIPIEIFIIHMLITNKNFSNISIYQKFNYKQNR